MKTRIRIAGLLVGLWAGVDACRPLLAPPLARLQTQPAPYVSTGI